MQLLVQRAILASCQRELSRDVYRVDLLLNTMIGTRQVASISILRRAATSGSAWRISMAAVIQGPLTLSITQLVLLTVSRYDGIEFVWDDRCMVKHNKQ